MSAGAIIYIFKRKKLRFTIVELTQVLKRIDRIKFWTQNFLTPNFITSSTI